MPDWRLWAGDLLVLAGLLFATTAVLGVARMPGVYNRIHSAGQALVLGVLPLAGAALVAAEAHVAPKVLALAVFLLITGPVSSHVIAKAAATGRGGEPGEGGVTPLD